MFGVFSRGRDELYIILTSSCGFLLLFYYEGLPWYEYVVVWVSLLPHSLLEDVCFGNTAHGYSRSTKEPLDMVQDEIAKAYKTVPFYRSANLINLALFMLSSYHHRLKTESHFSNIRISNGRVFEAQLRLCWEQILQTQEIAICFSVKTIFFFLARALSRSLYTQEKLRGRGSLLHLFKVEYECVEQSKWKLKFCNILIDCRDRELKWHEQVSRTSA